MVLRARTKTNLRIGKSLKKASPHARKQLADQIRYNRKNVGEHTTSKQHRAGKVRIPGGQVRRHKTYLGYYG